MSGYSHAVGSTIYKFDDLKTLLAKATPARSGDDLAGLSDQAFEDEPFPRGELDLGIVDA